MKQIKTYALSLPMILALLATGAPAFARQSTEQADPMSGGIQTAGADGGDPTEEYGVTQRRDAKAPDAEEATASDQDASAIHFRITVDYTTAYFFRGFRQEDRGFIIQPGGELGIDLHSSDSFSIGAIAGIWNSFHDRATGADENEDITDKWYEADLYAGLGGTIGNFGFSVLYITYTSPSDAWETIDEVATTLTYDDSAWWGESGFTLTPSLTFGWEVGSNFTDGADAERGLYLQPGITPAFEIDDVPLVDTVGLSFPITVGLSLDEYYEDAAGEDETFGFFSVGAKASIALPVPSAYGNWTLSGGAQLLILGDTTSTINDDEDTALIGSVGLTIAF